jgi:Protein of unknown function (DUF3617)
MPGLSLSTQAKVVPCANCGQTINTSMLQCPYCAAPVDSAAAEASAIAFAELNRAISDASYIRVMGGVAVGIFFARFIPFLGMLSLGFIFMEIAIPVMIIRWWARYRTIPSPDPEYRSARKTVLWVGAATVVVILLVNLLPYLIHRATTPPPLKAGLWSIDIEMTGNPGNDRKTQSFNVCRSHASDEQQELASKSNPACSTTVDKFRGSKRTYSASCHINGVDITMQTITTYSGDTATSATDHITFNPAVQGHTSVDGIENDRYIGPCPAGLKPGQRQ